MVLGRLWQSMTLLSQRMLVEEPAYHQAMSVLINDFRDTLPKHVIHLVTRSNERWNTVCRRKQVITQSLARVTLIMLAQEILRSLPNFLLHDPVLPQFPQTNPHSSPELLRAFFLRKEQHASPNIHSPSLQSLSLDIQLPK